jgi:hypothetical protein
MAVVGVQTITQNGESNQIRCRNYTDAEGNPAGGYAHGIGMSIAWQDGPRGTGTDGQLAPPNGAFVEDAIQAAAQRLAFFQQSKYAHPDNAEAIAHLDAAIKALGRRAAERRSRGVLGLNKV